MGLKPTNLEGLSLIKVIDLRSVDVRYSLAVLRPEVKSVMSYLKL